MSIWHPGYNPLMRTCLEHDRPCWQGALSSSGQATGATSDKKNVWEPLDMKSLGNVAALPHWRAAALPQHGLFTFLSHPQEHCNACSSTSLQPQSRAPMNCQARFSKPWLPRSLTKRAVKTVVLVVISQVRAIISDISMQDGQLETWH